MTRPTRVHIDTTALLHNLSVVKRCAPLQKIIAMVKANAYGCGVSKIVPTLEGHVDAFGVASLEEALALRALGSRTACILFQGVFSSDELRVLGENSCECVVHNITQVQWILAHPLPLPLKIWVKIDTGMHRLGISINEISGVISALIECPWVDKDLGIMTHFACADDPLNPLNAIQEQVFWSLSETSMGFKTSLANSAALLSGLSSQASWVRPGIMLYGVSPFKEKTGVDLGLRPVMRLTSVITAMRELSFGEAIGYGSMWRSAKKSRIGIIPIGYGDGYPREIKSETFVWVAGRYAPIVGRISMDVLMVDLTNLPEVAVGDAVELWGTNVPVEFIARQANTIAYELLCRISSRVR